MTDRGDPTPSPPDETGVGAAEAEPSLLAADLVLAAVYPEMPESPGLTSRLGPEMAQLLVVFLWSSTFIGIKAAFTEMSPLAFVFARIVLMLAIAFAVLLVRQQGAGRGVARTDWGRFVWAGLTGFTLFQLGFVLGLERTSPFSAALLIAMVPLFTVLILAFMGEPTPLQGWLGLAVALVGVAIFLFEKRDAGGGTLLGDLLSLGAAAAFAVYGIINRPLVTNYPAETYTAWSVLTGAAPLVLVSFTAATQQDWAGVSRPAWFSLIYLAIFPVYVAYILWNWAIARRGVAAASTLGLLVPIVSGVLSAIFFGETFGPLKLLGAALVLAGLVIVRTPLPDRIRTIAVTGNRNGQT